MAKTAMLGKNWRDVITKEKLPLAREAAVSVCPGTYRVDFDWLNAVFRVVVPEDFDRDADVETAIQKATGIGARIDAPPSYSYTTHLRQSVGLVNHRGVNGRLLPLKLQVRELVGFRTGLDLLKGIVEPFPFCATFAMGGLPLFNYIAPLPTGHDMSTDEGQEAYDEEVKKSRQKFHVHEGLLWQAESPTPKSKFIDWLSSIPNNASLVIIDATFSGGGINNIVNVLMEARRRPQHIEVHGLLDLSRTPELPPTREESDEAGQVRSFLHGVPRLITEDVPEFIGYDGLRDTGGLEARWDSANIEVCDGDDLLNVIGTSNIALVVSDLMKKFDTRGVSLDQYFASASTYMGLITQLGNERDRILYGVEKAWASRLIDDDTLMLERKAADRRYEAFRDRARALAERMVSN